MKYFFYIIACTLLFLIIFNIFADKSETSVNTATTFEWKKPVDIYLVDLTKAETESCEADVPLKRMILNAETFGPGALDALIKGPMAEESQKYFSAISPATLIQKFEVRDGVAYIDLSSELIADSGGSCRAMVIRSQIDNTLMALSDIDSVVLSVDGETEGILEP